MTKKQKISQLLLSFFLIASLIAPAALSAQTASGPAARVIVQVAGDPADLQATVEAMGGQTIQKLPLINAFVAELPESQMAALRGLDGVLAVTLDAPVVSTSSSQSGGDGPPPPNYFLDTLNVRPVWQMGYHGEGVTVAVIDSGITRDHDFSIVRGSGGSRVLEQALFSPNATKRGDETGHGTHVAGIVAGNGTDSDGMYLGVAPAASLLSLKISDDEGRAYESDTVAAMEWVLNHKDQYNIRVVNLSIQSAVSSSYHESPLDAAAEILWFNGIVVVAASGNYGNRSGHNTAKAAPANDPFIITVGATDENDTSDRSDDTLATYTAYGVTVDGYRKPEILAPGQDIVSVLAHNSVWGEQQPERTVLEGEYIRISGTSMAAPMVAGAAALMLQAEPDLTPDQVKARLIDTGYQRSGDNFAFSYMDVHAAVTSDSLRSANQDVMPHQLLAKMALIAYWANQDGEGEVNWDAVNWNAVNWNAVNWNAVNWNAVNWNAVNWNAVNWNAVNWNAVNWNAVNWNAVNWNAVNWNAVSWGE